MFKAISFILSIICSLIILCIPSSGAAYEMGPEVSIGSGGEHLDMVADPAGNLHLCYKKGVYLPSMYYRHQVMGKWEAVEHEVEGSYGTYNGRFFPRIAADSQGAAHFSWCDDTMSKVYYTSYNGNGWTSCLPVINDQVEGFDTNRNDITVDPDGQVWICAQSDQAIECVVKPIGAWFGEEEAIHYDVSEPKNPTVEACSLTGDLYCLYAKNEAIGRGLMYNRRHNDNWEAPIRPAGTGGPCCANYSSMTIDNNGELHVVWIVWTTDSDGFSTLYYSRRDSSGLWTEMVPLLYGPNYFNCWLSECVVPQVAVSTNGHVLVVFADSYDSSKIFFFMKEPGKPWPENPERLSQADSYQNYPAVVAVGDTFHITWRDSRNDVSIYYRTITFAEQTPSLSFIGLILVIFGLGLALTHSSRAV